jgi:hypothetical protein
MKASFGNSRSRHKTQRPRREERHWARRRKQRQVPEQTSWEKSPSDQHQTEPSTWSPIARKAINMPKRQNPVTKALFVAPPRLSLIHFGFHKGSPRPRSLSRQGGWDEFKKFQRNLDIEEMKLYHTAVITTTTLV